MNVKEIIKKIGELNPEQLTLLIECGIIVSKLEKEEQEKLMSLMDFAIENHKKRWEKEMQTQNHVICNCGHSKLKHVKGLSGSYYCLDQDEVNKYQCQCREFVPQDGGSE